MELLNGVRVVGNGEWGIERGTDNLVSFGLWVERCCYCILIDVRMKFLVIDVNFLLGILFEF